MDRGQGNQLYLDQIVSLRQESDRLPNQLVSGTQANSPLLRIEGNDNNSKKSTYWTTDAYYVRLKSIEEFGIHSQESSSKVGIEHLRVYANAYDPFDNLECQIYKKENTEAIEGWQSFYYPQLKVYSFGVNVSF